MGTLLQDLRYALRTLAGSPAFSCVAVLTLGIGIGATTAIFSVANHVAFRDLPYADPGRVVTLWEPDRVTGERSREVFGIRMAIGAHARDVLGMVLRQGTSVAVAGVAVGALAAFLLTRLLAGMLYGVSATDPVTFAVTALLLVAAARVTSLVPARRASRFDPMIALRTE